MITPKLEQLIWEGKAFFKTYVAGPQKSTLNIDNDRFIIITDVHFSGYDNGVADNSSKNVQLSIYGEKGFNHYIFRNVNPQFGQYYDQGVPGPIGYDTSFLMQPQTINTYLIHTTQVGFSFTLNQSIAPVAAAITPTTNPSYLPPLEYGKLGDVGAIPVSQSGTPSGGTLQNFFNNRQGFTLPDGTPVSQQIQYEASLANRPVIGSGYCVLNVNYVEILGKPENIMF